MGSGKELTGQVWGWGAPIGELESDASCRISQELGNSQLVVTSVLRFKEAWDSGEAGPQKSQEKQRNRLFSGRSFLLLTPQTAPEPQAYHWLGKWILAVRTSSGHPLSFLRPKLPNRKELQRFIDNHRTPKAAQIKHKTATGKKMAAIARALSVVYRIAPIAAGGAILASQSLFDVKGGTRAVIFDRLSGVKDDVINEGTHFLIPWLQKPIIFDVRTKPRSMSTTTGSKDLQMVSLTLRVLHRPNVKALPKIYQVCGLLLLLFARPCPKKCVTDHLNDV